MVQTHSPIETQTYNVYRVFRKQYFYATGRKEEIEYRDKSFAEAQMLVSELTKTEMNDITAYFVSRPNN